MAGEIKSKKPEEVSDIVDVGEGYQASQIQVESDTKIEDDSGTGGAAIVRVFEFAANPQAFKEYRPSKQELFNSHAKGIEIMLWRDGMTVMPEVAPKVTINKKKTKYRIIVGAKPAKGHMLLERPKTLKEIVHG